MGSIDEPGFSSESVPPDSTAVPRFEVHGATTPSPNSSELVICPETSKRSAS